MKHESPCVVDDLGRAGQARTEASHDMVTRRVVRSHRDQLDLDRMGAFT